MARNQRKRIRQCGGRQDAFTVSSPGTPSVNQSNRLFSWDTRAPTEATAKIQAHDREILSCAFSPACEHLIVTGSADKVCMDASKSRPTRIQTLFHLDCCPARHQSAFQKVAHFRVTHGRSAPPRMVSSLRFSLRIRIRRSKDQYLGSLPDWRGADTR